MLVLWNRLKYRWNKKSKSFFDRFDHVRVGPIPVRSLAEAHDLPGHHAVRPHIGRARELGVRDGFGRRPSHWNLATFGPVDTLGGRALDLATQTKVGHFTLEILVDEYVSGGKVL